MTKLKKDFLIHVTILTLYFIALVYIFFVLNGCSVQKDIIRDKTVQVPIPKFHTQLREIKPVNADSLLLDAMNKFATDSTYFEGSKVTEKGDKVNVKFYPKSIKTGKPKFEIDLELAPVPYTYRDTTHVVQEGRDLYDYLIVFVMVGIMVVISLKLIRGKI